MKLAWKDVCIYNSDRYCQIVLHRGFADTHAIICSRVPVSYTLPIQCVVRHLDYCPYNRGTMESRYHFRLSFSVMSGLSFFVICLYVWKPYVLPSCYFSIGLLDFAYSGICNAENFYVYVVRSISLKMWNFVLVLGPFHSKVIKESSIVKIGSLLIRTNLRRYK